MIKYILPLLMFASCGIPSVKTPPLEESTRISLSEITFVEGVGQVSIIQIDSEEYVIYGQTIVKK